MLEMKKIGKSVTCCLLFLAFGRKTKHYFVELYISVFLQHHKTKLWCCDVLRRYKMGILHCVKRVCIRAGKYVPEKL